MSKVIRISAKEARAIADSIGIEEVDGILRMIKDLAAKRKKYELVITYRLEGKTVKELERLGYRVTPFLTKWPSSWLKNKKKNLTQSFPLKQHTITW